MSRSSKSKIFRDLNNANMLTFVIKICENPSQWWLDRKDKLKMDWSENQQIELVMCSRADKHGVDAHTRQWQNPRAKTGIEL